MTAQASPGSGRQDAVPGRTSAGPSEVPGVVLVIGDVIDDIVIRAHGEVTHDSDTTSTIVRTPGGSAANAACWLGHLGVPVRFVGKVGAEDVDRHAAELARFGVDAHLAGDTEHGTGTIAILVDGESRTMFADRAANLHLSPADVPADVLDGVAWLHVTGYSLVVDGVREVTLDLMVRARAAGAHVSLDPASVAFVREVGAETFLTWSADVDLLLPNRDETALLAAAAGYSGEPDPVAEAAALAGLFDAVVATTGGTDAVVALRGERAVTVPVRRVEPVDPTGAGDSYKAGLIAALMRGDDHVSAAAAAAEVAVVAVSQPGARPR